MLELRSEFLCEQVAEVDEPQAVGPGPHGLRMIYPVKGGTLNGPKIKAEVLPRGADCFLMRSDGVCQLDVRVTIRTDDGALIYAYYRGIMKAAPDIIERLQKGEDMAP